MKRIIILSLVLISFFAVSCGSPREIEITDISVTPVDKKEIFAGDVIHFNFKYLAEARDSSEIGIQIDMFEKDETEPDSWKYLKYNPFAEFFQAYIDDNSEYIVENSTNCDTDWSLMTYYSFKGAKGLFGDETLSLKVDKEGEYRITVSIKDESRVISSLAWNCHSECEFHVSKKNDE